ncbi:peptidase C14 [Lepidopterella palustris CBS 459.81]|uniref:Peptidase C14 n=1 Tax=Lepidopterella palustris CBS 459.81 TaxID=1314670 RepID=A0A8E2EFK0_9PEZI|nr:peptidase C14 [Lepidopterella palustris CBS 459.81]
MSIRRKSLLIGINYTGSQHALQGCHQDVHNMIDFLQSRGYPSDPGSMVVLADDRDPRGMFFPTGRNILSAMDWLVSEPNTCCFLHYSGHGGQVRDPDGDRDSGFDDTIVPVDFETNGQIDSDTLHRHLVTALHPTSTLFVVFDCCHSGSAIELPFVYRTDEYGNVNLVDNVKQGIHLISAASHLIQGGFSYNKVNDARELLAGATSFFKSLHHMGQPQQEGLGEEHFVEDWAHEGKRVFMYSGCRDDQTSADAAISGSHVGAMSWAFLQAMRESGGSRGYQGAQQSYVDILQNTRRFLQGKYKQVPQLSVGVQMDLNQPLRI